MLHDSLIDTCCFGCNKLEILPPIPFFWRFHQVIPLKLDLILAIEGSEDYRKVFNMHFYPLMNVKEIAFIGKNPIQIKVDLVSVVFKTVYNSGSLILLAIVMAFAAGTAVWVMVSVFAFSCNHFFNCSYSSNNDYSLLLSRILQRRITMASWLRLRDNFKKPVFIPSSLFFCR